MDRDYLELTRSELSKAAGHILEAENYFIRSHSSPEPIFKISRAIFRMNRDIGEILLELPEEVREV